MAVPEYRRSRTAHEALLARALFGLRVELAIFALVASLARRAGEDYQHRPARFTRALRVCRRAGLRDHPCLFQSWARGGHASACREVAEGRDGAAVAGR